MQLVIGIPMDKCQMHNLVRHKFCHSWFYRGINPQLILNKRKHQNCCNKAKHDFAIDKQQAGKSQLCQTHQKNGSANINVASLFMRADPEQYEVFKNYVQVLSII